MSLRIFTDSAGNEWQAYDVIPRPVERRHYDRRSGEVRLDDGEDRRERDRRITVGGRSERLGKTGWLVFEHDTEHGTERRRLTPIPEDWHRGTDAELESYLRAARLARHSGMHGTLDQTPK